MRKLRANPEGGLDKRPSEAMQPEHVTRLVTERLNVGDAAGWRLCTNRRLCWPPRHGPVTGRVAIQAIYKQMVDAVGLCPDCGRP